MATPEPESEPTATPEPEPTVTPEPVPVVALDESNLVPLDDGRTYTLWIDDRNIGSFTDPSAASFELAIGPEADARVAVSLGVDVVASGTFADGAADLTFANVVGADFADATGQYILATPTRSAAPNPARPSSARTT